MWHGSDDVFLEALIQPLCCVGIGETPQDGERQIGRPAASVAPLDARRRVGDEMWHIRLCRALTISPEVYVLRKLDGLRGTVAARLIQALDGGGDIRDGDVAAVEAFASIGACDGQEVDGG